MSRPRLAAALLTFALVAPACASAYAWPLHPFDRPYRIRAVFGEPRTAFDLPPGAGGVTGPGAFEFNDGIDIVTPAGAAVYAVSSGRIDVRDATTVVVRDRSGSAFEYENIEPAVLDGADAVAGQTFLGFALESGYVRLSEREDGRPVNPLAEGHLSPHRDRTRPQVRRLELRNASGETISPLEACGRISLVAEAFDVPPVPLRGTWAGMRVAPALVRWRLVRVSTNALITERTSVDFRRTIPREAQFWDIYARGTYENMPRFVDGRLLGMPGRFLFSLVDGLDTRALPNGAYEVTVVAADVRENARSLTRRFAVVNRRTASGERDCPRPKAPR